MLFPTIPGWGLLLAVVWRLVPRHSCRTDLWLLFPAIPGWGLLLALVVSVNPRQSWWRALWVLFPAIPSWGFLRAMQTDYAHAGCRVTREGEGMTLRHIW